jgi:outer membrane protein assembly factor BamB
MKLLKDRRIRGAGLLLAALVMVGCASKDEVQPAPLRAYKQQFAGRQVWHVRLDEEVSFPEMVAVKDGKLFAADDDGNVVALDANDGHVLWRARTKDDLSAGVGTDGRWVAVVTKDNELVVFEEGIERWRAKLGSRIVTPPLVAGERVFVVGVDRIVQAYDAQDGHKIWEMARPGDALTLAQASVLTAYKDTLLVGQGSRLTGLDPLKGTVRWESLVATPRGTNEVERLSDLIGPASRIGAKGSVFCMRSYQTGVGCVDAEQGATKWSIVSSGTSAVAGDDSEVFATDASDRVTARRLSDGVSVWSNESFLNRRLSAPAALANRAVVFGDFEGQVHFLSRDTGETVLRLPTDGSAITSAPVVAGNTLIVLTHKGGLFAFRPD